MSASARARAPPRARLRRTSRRSRPSGKIRSRRGTDAWRPGTDASQAWQWRSGPSRLNYYPSMVVLALDTTTSAGSCALAVDGVVTREEGSDAALPPATRLPLDLMTLLEHVNMKLGDV